MCRNVFKNVEEAFTSTQVVVHGIAPTNAYSRQIFKMGPNMATRRTFSFQLLALRSPIFDLDGVLIHLATLSHPLPSRVARSARVGHATCFRRFGARQWWIYGCQAACYGVLGTRSKATGCWKPYLPRWKSKEAQLGYSNPVFLQIASLLDEMCSKTTISASFSLLGIAISHGF